VILWTGSVKVLDEMASTSRSPAIPPLLKHMNARTVFETIRAGAPISRAEIARRAGISKPTVSLALRSLEEAGLVRETDHDPDGPRYGAVFFEPVPDAALVLGLDLGARFVRGAICDLTGTIRVRQDVELGYSSAEAALDAIVALGEALVQTSGVVPELIDGVVVGVPGVVDEARGIHLSHFRSLEGSKLGADIERRLGLGVTLVNDVNLAALGEQWHGVAQGVDDFAFLSIGTGLGLGLVLDGELHQGRNGAAGELDYAFLGFQSVDPCATGISALAAELDRRAGAASTLVPPYEPREVFAAARGGNPLAAEVVTEVARRIALHIAPVSAVADVGLVVLGGGIGANGDLLLAPIRALLAGWLPYPPRVEISSLGEAAVLTGALAVGLRAARENVFVNRVRVTTEAAS
jgi:predicted NBD/HSP70 family sugar kinase